MDKPIEELRSDELAKSWSLVTYLVQTHREELFEFVRNTNTTFRGVENTPPKAFEDAFGEGSIERIEAEWRAWLAAAPDQRNAEAMPLR